MSRFLDKKTASDAWKLVTFMVITTLATGMLVVLIGNITFGGSRQYRAEFVDATGVTKGDDIRIAGVKVGTVKGIEIKDRSRALVTFTVQDSAELTSATHAQIRYRNLVGQRYISLSQQGADNGDRLDEGTTIPVSKTAPALDLTVLFNGFKPLFQALSPQDINQLSYEIVQVFQGEGGTVEGLLSHTASVTQTLAERDQVIGDLIDNLNETLVTIGNRDEEFSSLIVNLKTLVSGLATDKDALLGSLDSISSLSVETADLIRGIRKPLVTDIKGLRGTAGNLAKNRAELDRTMQVLPIKLNKVGRTAIYGSWFNFYLCNFTGQVKVAGKPLKVDYPTNSDRCSLP
ncbi:MCE family protein [Nocardioides guangzhouensis]|uniref:MCE family protein n=1 Tax=Nocardioides guangzhouensis TaxID=2497878 RepID=A0A4Q4Z582_9ACTN|nr:MCE family protein [Nocardioides guangzhouensis]RYP82930.1 MCE family protein [Nocardioides guangzhouensis]